MKFTLPLCENGGMNDLKFMMGWRVHGTYGTHGSNGWSARPGRGCPARIPPQKARNPAPSRIIPDILEKVFLRPAGVEKQKMKKRNHFQPNRLILKLLQALF